MQIRIGRWIHAQRRSNRGQSKGVENALYERRPVGCHRQRAPQLPISKNRVRTIVIRWIAQVELQEHVRERVVRLELQLGMLGDLGEILRSQLREQIRFARKESRQRRIEVRRQAPDQATELGCAAIVGRVGGELDCGARDPPHEPVLAGPNWILGCFGAAPAGRRDAFPDVLGHDRILIYGVVELLW